MSKLMELVERYGRRFSLERRAKMDKDIQLYGESSDSVLSEIRAKVQELERDAARYRYLRDPEQPDNIVTVQNYYGRERYVLLSGEEMDKAIDAAMEADK